MQAFLVNPATKRLDLACAVCQTEHVFVDGLKASTLSTGWITNSRQGKCLYCLTRSWGWEVQSLASEGHKPDFLMPCLLNCVQLLEILYSAVLTDAEKQARLQQGTYCLISLLVREPLESVVLATGCSPQCRRQMRAQLCYVRYGLTRCWRR